jgi:hypothetical protein
MSNLSLSADTYNLFPASPLNHVMYFSRLPYLSFVLQDVTLPGITAEPVVVKSGGMTMHHNSSTLQYDQLNVRFLVDEEFTAHRELHAWLLGSSGGQDRSAMVEKFIDEQTQYIFPELEKSKTLGRLSSTEAGLTIVNAAKIPILRFLFHNVMITSLGSVEFSTTVIDPNVPLTSSATFKYDWYTLVELRR